MAGVVALVPARAGSRRVPGKNVRPLEGHPLLAYTLAAAIDSGVFDAVVLSTDSDETAEIGRRYGAEVPFLRPAEMAGDLSPDIEWVRYTMDALALDGRVYDAFSILRPTSPLRQPATIERAWVEFSGDASADSLRAVEPCTQHPGKMWVVEGDRMRPLLDDGGADPPWHSRAKQALPPVHVQNASLEMARSGVLKETDTISGRIVRPFHCQGYEGFDINDQTDWWVLERLLAEGLVQLPDVRQPT
jgi:N-acylneuraminate cytidylyltransferase